MTYSVKEIFYTLQGEGANTGRPAVFCRFAGCNLWSGSEEDRGNAICNFIKPRLRADCGIVAPSMRNHCVARFFNQRISPPSSGSFSYSSSAASQ